MRKRDVSDLDYERLLAFRTGLRTFLKWSRDRAAAADLAPAQHQLILAIRGHPDHERGPTIGDVARYLLIKPNTAAELVGRCEKAGFVRRIPDPNDRRLVRLAVTDRGARTLASITEATLEELKRLATQLERLWEGLPEELATPRRDTSPARPEGLEPPAF
jgi:DNA-binding MarR family transcriptional regulator